MILLIAVQVVAPSTDGYMTSVQHLQSETGGSQLAAAEEPHDCLCHKVAAEVYICIYIYSYISIGSCFD